VCRHVEVAVVAITVASGAAYAGAAANAIADMTTMVTDTKIGGRDIGRC
jgi:hypothetical protein